MPERSARRLRWSCVAAALAGLVAVVIALSGLAVDRSPTAAAGGANLGALGACWIFSGIGWLALTVLWRLARREGWSGRSAWLVIAVAIAARVAVLASHDPQLSDDVYRYVFDGRNAAAGVNPYLVTPAERLGVGGGAILERPLGVIAPVVPASVVDERWSGEADVAGLVNNPELHTIYMPGSQYVFAVAGWLVPEAWSSPAASARVFRAVFVLFELGAIGLLLLVLRRQGRSPWWAALYAWHPLAITEIAGSGHQDAIGLFLLVAALTLAGLWPRRVTPWTAALALAAMIKPVVVPVAVLLLKGQTWHRWLLSAAVGAVVCAAVAAPLMLTHDRAPLQNWLHTADRFTRKWAHFGSVYEPVLTVIEEVTPEWINDRQEVLSRQICGGLLAAVVLGVLVLARDVWSGARAIFLAMVLLSSTAHPWYLLWALVLLPCCRSQRGALAVWVASLTLPWGYAQLGDTVEWTVPAWVMVVAYAPVYAALLLDQVPAVRRRLGEPAQERP